jgi:tetratricopeptide (TPR) repeat protein
MYELLKKLNFDIAEGNLLVGEANWEKVRNTIHDFFVNEGSPDDMLVFYYSGHGVLGDRGKIYLALSDTDPNDPYLRGYSFGDMTDVIGGTKSARVIVILDCCYSGSAKIGKGSEKDVARKWRGIMEESSKNLQQEQQMHVKCILAASQSHQEAYALKEEEHSVFTKYLLKGLKGEDNDSVDNEGHVTAQLLGDYVYRAIKRLPPNERPHQDPIIITEGSTNIILASYPKLKPLKIENTLASMLKLLREGNVQEFNKMRETNSAILPEPDFSEKNLHGARIAGANLSNANLNRVDFSEADLEGANLTNANFYRAHLDGANLSNTNCTNAVFEAANLSNANLTKANLSNANLTKANLYRAKIFSEDLQQARADGAIYEPPDKTRVTGRKRPLGRKTKISITVGIATVIIVVLGLVLYNQQMLTNGKIALYDKGAALNKTGNYTGAITYFDQALHMDPNFKDALNALQMLSDKKSTLYDKGVTLLRDDNYTESIKYFDQVLAIDPKYDDALDDKGTALNNLGKYKEAIIYLNRSLAIDANDQYALKMIGWALDGLGNYTQALNHLNTALHLIPNDTDALTSKGWALNGLRNYTGAIIYLDEAIKINPNNNHALSNKGWSLLGLGNYTGAIIYLDEALAKNPKNVQAICHKSVALDKLGNHSGAIS